MSLRDVRLTSPSRRSPFVISVRPPRVRLDLLSAACLSLSLAVGCDSDTNSDTNTNSSEPSTLPMSYEFESRFSEGQSSVSYSGQVARHALLNALIKHIEGLEGRLLSGALVPSVGDVVAELELFYDCEGDVCAEEAHGVEAHLPTAQATMGELSSGKNITGKVAGNDPIGQTRDWSMGLDGWSPSLSPDELVRAWFTQIEQQSLTLASGERVLNPVGEPITKPYLTPEGLNLAELTAKFMYGALGLSQAADDYLDDDLEGKGLLSDNVVDDGGYTALEHAWDEAFGYFGVARDLPSYTLEEVAGAGGRDEYQRAYDTNGDGQIDLTSEYQWSAARYAARRDVAAGTTFTSSLFEAFLAGRALISSAEGALTPSQLEELQGYRDEALYAWEASLALSTIHYLNEVLADLDKSAEEWDFESHATHWSELKGFALTFQFNPRATLSASDLEALHEAIGVSPVWPTSDAASAHREALLSARALLGERFELSDEALGGL